jgi:hypothetical protein
LAENIELLRQQVDSRRQKFTEATSVMELKQQRLESTTAVHDEVDHEHQRLKSSLRVAKRRARRLAKQTKRARRLARAASDDRRDAENELAEHVKRRDKQQSKLTEAEAALAAAETRAAEERTTPPKSAAPRRRAASAAKGSVSKQAATKSGTSARSARKSPTKRTAARKTARR